MVEAIFFRCSNSIHWCDKLPAAPIMCTLNPISFCQFCHCAFQIKQGDSFYPFLMCFFKFCHESQVTGISYAIQLYTIQTNATGFCSIDLFSFLGWQQMQRLEITRNNTSSHEAIKNGSLKESLKILTNLIFLNKSKSIDTREVWAKPYFLYIKQYNVNFTLSYRFYDLAKESVSSKSCVQIRTGIVRIRTARSHSNNGKSS